MGAHGEAGSLARASRSPVGHSAGDGPVQVKTTAPSTNRIALRRRDQRPRQPAPLPGERVSAGPNPATTWRPRGLQSRPTAPEMVKCGDCAALHSCTETCPECGHDMRPRAVEPVVHMPGRLVEMPTSAMEHRAYAAQQAFYSELIEIARARNYKRAWVALQAVAQRLPEPRRSAFREDAGLCPGIPPRLRPKQSGCMTSTEHHQARISANSQGPLPERRGEATMPGPSARGECQPA